MLAIYDHQTTTVKKLVRENVDLNYISKTKNNSWQLTALEVAIRIDDADTVNLLLATKKIAPLGKAFMVACGQDNEQIVELLIGYGANPNEELPNGYSASMMAINFGSIKILEALLKNGVNPNHKKSGGMTLLMFAAYNCHLEKAKLLLKNGAKKEITDSKGQTALDYAKKIYISGDVNPDAKKDLIKLLAL